MDGLREWLFNGLMFSILGPVIEVLYTGFDALRNGDVRGRGHVSIKMFPAYAFVELIFPKLYAFVDCSPFYLRWLAFACVAHLLELCFGWYLLRRTGKYHWFYEGMFHVRHHTSIAFLPIFFLASGACEWIFLHVRAI